jgi:D-alanyl-D-alanine dipeptidase
MKKIFILSALFSSLQMAAASWQELINQYRPIMGEETYQLIQKQYQAYREGQAPAIADARIKQIAIVECGEGCVDVNAANNARLSVMYDDMLIKAHESPEDIDPRSAGHSQVRKGVYDCLLSMIDELDRLAPAFDFEVGDLQVILFEGLRDIATQKELFDSKMIAIQQKNPHMSQEEVYAETCKWVSPYINNVPVHSAGAAIDIHLYSKRAGNFCDIGRFNVGSTIAPMFSDAPKLTDIQRKNRLLFLVAATRAGFTNYVYEFWHFSYGDRYAAYWRQTEQSKREAIYGSV